MPAAQRFPWKRFWCPRGGRISLSDRGYLADPDTEMGHLMHPHVVAYEAIDQRPCLVLLGEPGIGKSDAIEREYRSLASRAPAGTTVSFIKLPYDTEADLFESEAFAVWSAGKVGLHLFIDGLDESPRKDFAARLIGKLRRGPIENLRLRIACRTAELPHVVENELPLLWGPDGDPASLERNVGFYELVPLRRADIALAAGDRAEAFFEEVTKRRAEPFAMKPMTLRFLLDHFRRHSSLPRTRRSLFLKGCLALCDEQSSTRRDLGDLGKLRAAERLAVAARIAAVSVLASRPLLWRALDPWDMPEDAIQEKDLTGGTEPADGGEVTVGLNEVTETLQTGLFSARGAKGLGFAHQTHAEFLTAHFLYTRGFGQDDLSAIFFHPAEPTKVVPQLRETAAWLASMSPGFFRALAEHNSEVLLGSDVAHVEEGDRERLVDYLLKAIEKRDLNEWGLLFSRFAALAHSGLAAQLDRYLRDKRRDPIVRRTAASIAGECGLEGLQGLLADIALDAADDHRVRSSAAHALLAVGSGETLLRLRPLIWGSEGDDSEELKGVALTALWPRHIPAADVFAATTRPKNQHYWGSYQTFIHEHLTGRLDDNGLVEALSWAERQVPLDTLSPFREAVEVILERGWESLDDEPVRRALAHVAVAKLRHHEPLFDLHAAGRSSRRRSGRAEAASPMANDTDRRRLLLACLLETMPELPREQSTMQFFGLVCQGDTLWILNNMAALANGRSTLIRRWTQLAVSVARWESDVEEIEALLRAAEAHPEAREVLATIFSPIDIESEEAQRRRDRLREIEEMLLQREPKRLDPPPSVRVEELLRQIEGGDVGAFCSLLVELSLEPIDTPYPQWWSVEPADLPGWKSAEESTRSRILDAAKRYVREHLSETHAWVGKSSYPTTALAGYAAIRMIWLTDPSWVAALPQRVIRHWAPIIVGHPTGGLSPGGSQEHQELLALAYREASTEVLWTLAALLHKEAYGADFVSILRGFDLCWDDRLGYLLMLTAQDPLVRLPAAGQILGLLVEKGSKRAREHARSLLRLPLPADERGRAQARYAAEALLLHDAEASWSTVWAAMRSDSGWGVDAMMALCRYGHTIETRLAGALSEADVAALVQWLHDHIPGPQSVPEGAHIISDEEQVADLRDALINGLAGKGTPAAVAAIEQLAKDLPGLKDWAFVLVTAKNAMQLATWKPMSPADVIRFRPRRSNAPVRLFVSFAPSDRDIMERLFVHLSLLVRQGKADVWHDDRVGAGHAWDTEARARLESAQAILLAVSADFFADDRCWGTYLATAIDRHEAGSARVIPIIVRPCVWRTSPLGKLQALPKNEEPISSWADPEEAWAEIAAELESFLD